MYLSFFFWTALINLKSTQYLVDEKLKVARIGYFNTKNIVITQKSVLNLF